MWGMFCRYFGPFQTEQDPPDKEAVPQLTVEKMTINKDWIDWYCKNDPCSEDIAYKVGAKLLITEIYAPDERWRITLLPRDIINPYLVRVYRKPPIARGLVMQTFNIPSPAVVETISQVTKASHTMIMRSLSEKMNDGVFMTQHRLPVEKARAYSNYPVFQFSVCDQMSEEVQTLVMATLSTHGWTGSIDSTLSQHSPNVTITLYSKDLSLKHG